MLARMSKIIAVVIIGLGVLVFAWGAVLAHAGDIAGAKQWVAQAGGGLAGAAFVIWAASAVGFGRD